MAGRVPAIDVFVEGKPDAEQAPCREERPSRSFMAALAFDRRHVTRHGRFQHGFGVRGDDAGEVMTVNRRQRERRENVAGANQDRWSSRSFRFYAAVFGGSSFFFDRVIMQPVGTSTSNAARIIQSATSVIVMSSPTDVEIPT